MGCGSSAPSNSVSPAAPDDSNKSKNNSTPSNALVKSHGHRAGTKITSDPKSQDKFSNQKSSSMDDNANRKDVSTNNEGPKGGIAFDVSLDGRKVNSLIMKHPPKRLQRLQLEPLNLPKMTPEMLLEKQQLADEKRQNELQKKRDASQKTSKRRRDLVLARQFEQQQKIEQVDSHQKAADKLRETKQQDIIVRQKMREERAKRVREKAKRLQQAEDCDIPDLEKDETFNADDDSWDEDTGEDYGYDSGDRIYSGHGSPKKRAHSDSGIGVRNVTSAGTMDSYDNAFMNDPKDIRKRGRSQAAPIQDDFFDT